MEAREAHRVQRDAERTDCASFAGVPLRKACSVKWHDAAGEATGNRFRGRVTQRMFDISALFAFGLGCDLGGPDGGPVLGRIREVSTRRAEIRSGALPPAPDRAVEGNRPDWRA